MSYVIDVYRRDIKPTKNFIEFADVRLVLPAPRRRPDHAADDAPAADRSRRGGSTSSSSTRASYLIFWGLTKKVVVADNLALHRQRPLRPLADDRRRPRPAGGLRLRVPDLLRLLGLHRRRARDRQVPGLRAGPELQPAVLRDQPAGVLGRWHISLSTWLRDYLYIPLGGSRGGTLHALPQPDADDDHRRPLARRGLDVRALGLLSGRLARRPPPAQPWLDRINPTEPFDRACWTGVRIVATFHMVCLGWLIFRAESIAQMVGMLSAIVTDPRSRPRPTCCPSRSRSSRSCWSSSFSTCQRTSTDLP